MRIIKSYLKKEYIYKLSWSLFLITGGWFLNKMMDSFVFPSESLANLLFKKMQTYNNTNPLEMLFPIALCSFAIFFTSTIRIDFVQKASKEKKFFHIFVTIVLYGLFISSVFYVSAPIRGKAIDNNIVIISPYISEQETKVLKSRLLQISNEEDYKSLKKDIEDIALKHHAKLQ